MLNRLRPPWVAIAKFAIVEQMIAACQSARSVK
jgi:hypothetical protein